MSTANQIIAESTIKDNVLYLPPRVLDRNVYLDVKKALEHIGGKWKGGKVAGFVFPNDPTNLVQHIIDGHNPNLKKDFQFFATPAHIADQMVDRLFLHENRDNGFSVLEPEAGQGALIDAVFRVKPLAAVSAYELMDVNYNILKDKYNGEAGKIWLMGKDFLDAKEEQFDYIIANPPFSKNQDIAHIYKMHRMLAPGGRMVTLASRHWENSILKRETTFREWLADQGATIDPIEAGEFKSSGTMVSTVMITIDK